MLSLPLHLFRFSSPAQNSLGVKHTLPRNGSRLLWIHGYHSKRIILSSTYVNVSENRQSIQLPRKRPNRDHLKTLIHPVVVSLSPSAFSALLPISGTGEEVLKQLGGPQTWLRRFIVSFAGALLLYNLSMFLTVVVSLYWVWCPMFSAARANTQLRMQYPHAGIWRARVQECQVVPSEETERGMLWVLVGDDSGTAIELLVENPPATAVLRGDPAEVLVLSDSARFPRFKALKEAFLPNQGVWISESTHIEKVVFQEMSAELASLLQETAEVEDEWEVEFSMAASDVEQDMESFGSYSGLDDSSCQLGEGYGTSEWSHFEHGSLEDGEVLGLSSSQVWVPYDSGDLDNVPDNMRS